MPDKTRDIEETDEILDSYEKDPIDFWEKKQRELVTSVVDYNLSTLSDLVKDKVIDLCPQYQRRFRWDKNKQSRLIESFLMNVPVPPIFLNEDSYGKYSVIDGKQRLIAINEFMEGRLILKGLEVFSDINGLSFDKLPSKLKQVLRTRPTVRSIIILRQSDSDVKYEVFQRLNTGGVSLNPQEIRNSVYGGSLNDLIQKLSENDKFHKLLGVVKKESSSIYKAMRDAEFVLRFFTFKNRWQKISGSMKRLMDEFMHKNRNASSKKLKELEREFLVTIEVVEKAFGKYSFKRWLPKYNRWRNQILASLYDAEMFACTRFSAEEVDGKQDYIVKQLKLLFEDDSFRESIEVGTNAPVRFRKRITNIIEMLSKIIGKTGFKKGL